MTDDVKFKVGQTVQDKQTRMRWEIESEYEYGFVLRNHHSEIEIPFDIMDKYFSDKLKLYQSLGHMVMKDDIDFLNDLANRLENYPIIDGIDKDYIQRLRSIVENKYD